MMKTILKWFLPSSQKLSVMAAESICNAVNGLNKEEQIIKFMTYANTLTEIQTKICMLLKDGKLDESEKQQLAIDIEPFIEKLFKMI